MNGIPLFPGDSEIDQIFKIFRCVRNSWILYFCDLFGSRDCAVGRLWGLLVDPTHSGLHLPPSPPGASPYSVLFFMEGLASGGRIINSVPDALDFF